MINYKGKQYKTVLAAAKDHNQTSTYISNNLDKEIVKKEDKVVKETKEFKMNKDTK